MITKILETDRLIARNWKDSDRELFHFINSDEQVMEFFHLRRSRKDSDALLDILKSNIDEKGYGFSAIELKDTGECIGLAGLHPSNLEPVFPLGIIEIGWRLAPAHWGNGYASEAATAFLDFGFQNLKLEEIYSFAVHNNNRSLAVMERIGLQPKPEADFDHPHVPDTHPDLKRHLLYSITNDQWRSQNIN